MTSSSATALRADIRGVPNAEFNRWPVSVGGANLTRLIVHWTHPDKAIKLMEIDLTGIPHGKSIQIYELFPVLKENERKWSTVINIDIFSLCHF